MSLYRKMFEIMNSSKSLEKDMNVAGQYNAVSEKVMLNTIKPLLKEHGVIIFPIKTEIEEVAKGNKTITQVNVTYKIVDTETGESETLSGVGNGADTQDKGAGKAFTYAYKAMLSKTFMLFSGEDTDNDHSDDITKKQQDEKLDSNQVADILALLEEKGKDRAWFEVKTKKNVSELKANSYTSIIKWINENA